MKIVGKLSLQLGGARRQQDSKSLVGISLATSDPASNLLAILCKALRDRMSHEACLFFSRAKIFVKTFLLLMYIPYCFCMDDSSRPTECACISIQQKVCQSRRRNIEPVFDQNMKGKWLKVCRACRIYENERRYRRLRCRGERAQKEGLVYCENCRESKERSCFLKEFEEDGLYKRCFDCRKRVRERLAQKREEKKAASPSEMNA